MLFVICQDRESAHYSVTGQHENLHLIVKPSTRNLLRNLSIPSKSSYSGVVAGDRSSEVSLNIYQGMVMVSEVKYLNFCLITKLPSQDGHITTLDSRFYIAQVDGYYTLTRVSQQQTQSGLVLSKNSSHRGWVETQSANGGRHILKFN